MESQLLKVAVTGACGKVGQEMIKAVATAPDLDLVGAVDIIHLGEDIGELVGIGKRGVPVTASLDEVMHKKPDVVIDFTNAKAALQHITAAITNGVSVVSGSTGLTGEEIDKIKLLCEQTKTGAVVAPNFALGAVLMFRLSQEVAKWFEEAEIIELHHSHKLDAPSGTALRTAELIREVWKANGFPKKEGELPGKLAGSAQEQDLAVHSVRLPGLVAHQEVIFGALGQTLTIRHDSYSRESFVPGVMLAVRRVKSLKGVVFGLENLIFK